MKRWLVGSQDHQVVGIPEIISNAFLLFKPVIETGQVKIREILAQIVTDRQAGRTIDDLLQKP